MMACLRDTLTLARAARRMTGHVSSASIDGKSGWGSMSSASMSSAKTGVLLIDWDNLAGAVIGRRKMVTRSIVDDLRKFADRACGGQLRHAHMAAVRFDGTIAAAMDERLIKPERVGTTKEQADILLTVLAMDYLYEGVGKFILVTGDQDFIPLISRLNGDGRDVTVVYGDCAGCPRDCERSSTPPPAWSRWT